MKEKLQPFNLFWLFFLMLSILGTIRIVMFGQDVDEQYAVAMAYRMVCGDRMFLEMWEPHQTSGFLAAVFIKLFMILTGGIDYLVIYLRVVGVVIQFIISVFLYDTMKKFFSKDVALGMAFFFYNTISKNSPVPEFTNMLLWFSVITFLCLMRFVENHNFAIKWLVLAGIFSSLLVLSYPTCILAVIPVLIGIWVVSEQKQRLKNCAGYMGTCACCGIAYLLYFLSHMSIAEFMFGFGQMCTDGSHSATLLNKLAGYVREDMLKLAPHMLISVGMACAIWFLIMFFQHKRCDFLMCLLLSSCLEQGYVWIFQDNRLKFPSIFYFVLLVIGVFRYIKSNRLGLGEDALQYKSMFWFGSIMALFIWIAALLTSNTYLYDTVEYTMVGLIAAIGYTEYEYKENKWWWKAVILVLLGVALFRRGYLMYYTYGKDTVFVTKQKAVSGPLAGIYCRWSEGVNYNLSSELIKQYIPEGSNVLFVGTDVVLYLQGEQQVSNFSTICTPTFDERLYTYWEHYPKKYPEYVVWDTGIYFRPSEEMTNRLLTDCMLIAEEENWRIYRMEAH
ncbi:MAG: glycosyltransferase family 39 protein [Acetatifactor sp.]|nr:glycosyltransferase family 39 protein [Acetatifactor sp.]